MRMVIWELSSGGGLMSDFSLHFCQECSDSLQNYRSWGSILFLGRAVFSGLPEAYTGMQTEKPWSKEGWFWSWASQSERFLMFPGIHGWFSDEPSMPRGTLDIICLRGTFPAGFLPSLSNISIKTASKEISWENHNVDGTNPAGIVVLDRNNSKLAGDTFGGLGNTCRVV